MLRLNVFEAVNVQDNSRNYWVRKPCKPASMVIGGRLLTTRESGFVRLSCSD